MLQTNRKVGLVFFPAFDWAISPNHPEREERLLYTQDQVFEEGLLDIEGIREFKPDTVTPDDVRRVHFCVPDVHAVMTESHFISAGGAKTIGAAVMEKTIESGFALVRPPGHHAMRIVHGARGFCNINIEAVMIEYLRRTYGVDRIAIVDTDCHHGDGTQDIYWHDPDTLFISLHQDGRTLYPGSGFLEEAGGPTAAGSTLNIPLPPYTSEQGFLHVIQEVVLPVLDEFKPDLIVNSAGQDNHFSDPITNMNFSAQGYADLTRLLSPDIAVLEGGYAIEGALPYVNLGIIMAMAGLDYSHVKEPDYDPESHRQTPEVTRWIEHTGRQVLDVWHQRHQVRRRRIENGGEFETRTRTVHYDTDSISESQTETLRLCRDCAGAWKIDSRSSRNSSIVIIRIPRKCCPACRDTGYAWYEKERNTPRDAVFLQDRSEDTFLTHKNRLQTGDRY